MLIAIAHGLVAGGLWTLHRDSPTKRPLLVPIQWIAPQDPAPPARPPQPTQRPPTAAAPAQPAPQPESHTPAPAAVPTTPVAESTASITHTPAAVAPPPSPGPLATATAPAVPPPRPTLNAPRYLIEPRLNLPLASRRLGEQGLVQLRLHIGTQGELIEASLARSSGFERLDQQALRDIRSARFAPVLDNGRPIEWDCLALLSYELTR